MRHLVDNLKFFLNLLLPLLHRQWAKGIDSFQDTEPLTFFSDASNGIEEWIFCYCYSLLSLLMSLMLSIPSTEGGLSSLNYLMELPKSLKILGLHRSRCEAAARGHYYCCKITFIMKKMGELGELCKSHLLLLLL